MKKRQLITLLIVTLFIVIFPHIAFARQVEINADKAEIKAGDKITISVKIKDVSIEEGMNSMQGQLVYDKDDWEQVTKEDIKKKNNWSITYNDEETESEGKFILINFGSGEVEEQELLEITLKSKKKIIGGNSEIKLTELYTTDGENMIKMEDQAKEINIQGDMLPLVLISILVLIAIIVVIVIITKRNKEVRK